jgi:hypothetical protein
MRQVLGGAVLVVLGIATFIEAHAVESSSGYVIAESPGVTESSRRALWRMGSGPPVARRCRN